jgi:hypothetical protein
MAGNHSNDRRGFLTILDNALTVYGLPGGKEQACRSQPQSGGLPEGAGGGTKNGKVANVAEALRGYESAAKNKSTSLGPTLKKLKINAALSSTV